VCRPEATEGNQQVAGIFQKLRDQIMNVQKDACLSHGVTMLHMRC